MRNLPSQTPPLMGSGGPHYPALPVNSTAPQHPHPPVALTPPPPLKLPTRVEWDNEAVDVFVEDDEEAMLMTAQEGVRN